MKRFNLIFSILTVFALAGPLLAQQGALPAQPGAKPAAPLPPSGAVENAAQGIRFTLIDPTINPRTVFIPMGENVVKKISFRPHFPTERINFPQGGKLFFYEEPPLVPVAQGKKPAQPIFASTIPTDKGNKIIGLIGKTAEGKLYIVYIEDSEMKPGLTLIRNMTSKEYLMDIPKPPTGEQKRIPLKPGQSYLFGKNVPESEGTGTYGTTLMHQVPFKGELRWLPNRRFMLTRSSTKSFIKLLLPNPATKDMIVSDITLMIDSSPATNTTRKINPANFWTD